mmetsp:Transcript_35680/g.61762  ORF Transcript_35680/g.61762 Transcript_35680/m.61762 type:complete len:103 (-) Transcript_35680:96-404(-)
MVVVSIQEHIKKTESTLPVLLLLEETSRKLGSVVKTTTTGTTIQQQQLLLLSHQRDRPLCWYHLPDNSLGVLTSQYSCNKEEEAEGRRAVAAGCSKNSIAAV